MDQEARVLVIEDSSSTRQIICDYLESQGVHTDSAANGQAGIEAFRRRHPDIAIEPFADALSAHCVCHDPARL